MNHFKKATLTALLLSVGTCAIAAPNYELAAGTVICKHLRTLEFSERIKLGEYVTPTQAGEVNNDCSTLATRKQVTAISILLSSKVEFFALGQLDVYYVNTRDLVSPYQDEPSTE
jgi:hypothetical protein